MGGKDALEGIASKNRIVREELPKEKTFEQSAKEGRVRVIRMWERPFHAEGIAGAKV